MHNLGSDGVQNATVRFWWANPGTNFDRTTANHVGDSYVTLAAGETQDVLCLTPWNVSFVNGGHECILGEAFEKTLDPLPPGPNFNVVADRHDLYERRLADDREAVQQAAAEVLSARQQRILQLSFEGWLVQDIAAKLGLPPERVSDEKYKSVRKLRAHFISGDKEPNRDL